MRDGGSSTAAGDEVMSIITFVVKFEDGNEPPVTGNMEIFGGKVIAASFYDALENIYDALEDKNKEEVNE